ncbi:MAG: M4 family metallopeptidase, partial [Bacteroidetes bacterium]|nr:M4 family metallopeptidase [Bacteroidota bacterium]
MKRILTSFLVTFLCLSFSYAQTIQRDPGMKKFPRFINLEQSTSLQQKKQVFSSQFEMTQNDELRSVESKQDQLGYTHEKHQQYYKGIKVEGATFTVHAMGSQITHLSGNFEYVRELDITPTLSATSAFSFATSHVGATQYAWDAGNKLGLDMARPQGELVILPDYLNDEKDAAKLAYKFDIYAAEPISRSYVFVDAHNGQIIQQIERIHEANVAATGTSLYNGTVSFTADNASGPYRLRQTSSGGGVQTYDLNNGTNYGAATDITSGSTSFTGNPTGVQAHWGAEQTWDYFWTAHSRNSYNGSGGVLRSYVSYSSNYVNAFWDGTRMTYGDGDGVNYGPLVSADITGHEITHGVTEYSANLVYQRESGALNESFSDIFGEMIEFHATGSNDWQMGTDIGIGGSGAIRSMNNPNLYGDPDTYGGSNWYNPNCGTPTQFNDYCGVHTNSGVQNKWFYILAAGESGTNDIGNSYSVTGIGRTAAAAIAYRNLTVYLSSSSTYADARAGAIQAAVDLYGSGSAQEIATTDAWYAVGVGSAYGAPASYCSSNGNNVNDEYIQRVQLNTIDNSNTSSPSGGYTNYTSISTDLTINSNYTITITPLWTGTVYSEGYSVWIDYNNDADFNDAGEQVWTQSATTSSPVSGSFTVPASATQGPTRMRVSMKYNGIPTACESFTYGEVEDYTVNIT